MSLSSVLVRQDFLTDNQLDNFGNIYCQKYSKYFPHPLQSSQGRIVEMFPDRPPPLPLPTSDIPQSDQENQFFLPICLVLTAKLTQERFSLTKAACQAPRLVNCKNSACQTECPVQKYKLEKEMQREERISRQWPPSEIAMENGNTMIPPVARTWTGQHGPGGSAMQFQLYTNYNSSAWNSKLFFHCIAILVFLTVRRENYY